MTAGLLRFANVILLPAGNQLYTAGCRCGTATQLWCGPDHPTPLPDYRTDWAMTCQGCTAVFWFTRFTEESPR